MRSMFTVHAGEYLVGSYIEEKFKDFNVWVPSKDTGVDLLVSDSENKNTVSLQVKFSRDFSVTHVKDIFFRRNLNSFGWCTLNRDKMKQSSADFWVFVLHSFNQKNTQFVIIEPEELLKRLTKLHSDTKIVHSYLCVTNEGKCWEVRGIRKQEKILIVKHRYENDKRDFTKFLNNWEPIKRHLSVIKEETS